MFAWWGRTVVRLRWLVLAVAAAILVLGGTWGGGVFGDLISGGFDDPSSPSSKAHRAITEQLGRQDVDVIALYSLPEADSSSTTTEATLTARGEAPSAAQLEAQRIAARLQVVQEVTSVRPGPVSDNGRATYLAIQLRDGDENSKLDDLAAVEPLLRAEGQVKTQVGGLIPFLDDANRQISDDITRAEIISLPMYPHLSREQVRYVAEQVREVV